MKKIIKNRFLVMLFLVFVILLFILYGPFSFFREFLITSSMSTMNHKYLAEFLYSDSTISYVLSKNTVKDSGDVTNPNLISIDKNHFKSGLFTNKYEKEILNHDNKLYKVIKVKGNCYNGFFVVIYDPSKVFLSVSKSLGDKGENILSVSKRENSVVSINGGGFYDPDWNSNGAIAHGTVIKNGKIISDYSDSNMGGGFIGFNKDDKLILGRMSKEEALKIGYRDAIEFGPFLIVNGKKSIIKGNGGFGVAPRTAIGQRRDGIVLFLVINGRIPTSIGADMNDLCDIMKKYGAYNAANLDGGSSSELVVKNKIVNRPVAFGKKGLRDMATFWIVKK